MNKMSEIIEIRWIKMIGIKNCQLSNVAQQAVSIQSYTFFNIR